MFQNHLRQNDKQHIYRAGEQKHSVAGSETLSKTVELYLHV